MSRGGKLYLIGAGPGDPELLTLKAARVLRECDVLLYDRLVSPEILALAKPCAQKIYVGKHQGEQEQTQEQIFELIRSHALAGRTVGRVKGGDPLIFGRGAEEWGLALESGIEVELVPGVSSAIAVPGLAGIPLTYRRVSQSFAVITGHCHLGPKTDWSRYAQIHTLVILMGVKNRILIARALIDAGRRLAEPVAFIQNGSTPQELVIETTQEKLARGEVTVSNPAVLVIGEVVRLRRSLTAGPQPTPESDVLP